MPNHPRSPTSIEEAFRGQSVTIEELEDVAFPGMQLAYAGEALPMPTLANLQAHAGQPLAPLGDGINAPLVSLRAPFGITGVVALPEDLLWLPLYGIVEQTKEGDWWIDARLTDAAAQIVHWPGRPQAAPRDAEGRECADDFVVEVTQTSARLVRVRAQVQALVPPSLPPPPPQALWGEHATRIPKWLMDRCAHLRESDPTLGGWAAAGAIARLWTLPRDLLAQMIKINNDQDSPRHAIQAWVAEHRLGEGLVLLERTAVEDAEDLLRDLEHYAASPPEGPTDVRDELIDRRDTLESVWLALRSSDPSRARGAMLGAALREVDNAAWLCTPCLAERGSLKHIPWLVAASEASPDCWWTRGAVPAAAEAGP